MVDPRVRFSRQIRLPEIGEDGQARLSSSEVRPTASGFARVVEARYLAHAGVRVIEDADPAGGSRGEALARTSTLAGEGETAGEGDESVTTLLRHAAAREIADGAVRALRTLRRIVDEAARRRASS